MQLFRVNHWSKLFILKISISLSATSSIISISIVILDISKITAIILIKLMNRRLEAIFV